MSDPNDAPPGAGPVPPPGEGKPPVPPPAGETAPRERPAVPTRPPVPPVQIGGNVGGDVAGGDLNKEVHAGRDIVGRDVVTTTTTNVGFGVAAVQRLVLAVGILVAATAACFFVLGSVAAVGVVAVINGPPNNNNPVAAKSFEAKLAALSSLPPGQAADFSFSEEEISSYFHLVIEPSAFQGQVSDGQVRFLDSGQLVFAGRADRLGGIEFAATFDWQTNKPHQPLRLTETLLDVVPLGNSPVGWVEVPTAALGWMETAANGLFENIEVVGFHPQPQGKTWSVQVVTP